jgi:hypothetical protein
MIKFKSTPYNINDFTIVHLDKDASKAQLPSRGPVMVEGKINDIKFDYLLFEPDGTGSHWFRLEDKMLKAIDADEPVSLEVEIVKEWPEPPSLPKDLEEGLKKSSKAVQELWLDITPMSRWEWTRWINGTRNQATRDKRINVALSKLSEGERRPCCFNRSGCYDPDLSRSGVLMKPGEKAGDVKMKKELWV